MAAYETQLPQVAAKFEETATRIPTWVPLEPADMKSAGKATFTKNKDLSILVGGPNPAQDTYTLKFDTKIPSITGLRLEVLPDKTLPGQGPGRAPNGNFVLQELIVTYVRQGSDEKAKPIKLIRPQATFAQDTFPIANAVDNNPDTGWAVSPQFGKPQVAVFELQGKLGSTEGTTLNVSLVQNYATRPARAQRQVPHLGDELEAAGATARHGAGEYRQNRGHPEGPAHAGRAYGAGQLRALA